MLIILAAIVVGLVMLVFGLQGPPFVASDDESAAQMLKLIKRRRPQRILDMGSGDGKLVMLLAEQGYHVTGIELNPLLVWRSRRVIRQAGLSDRATVKWGNFWRHDTGSYDLVTLYAIKHIMPRLENKLRAELKSGARVVSNYFVFPTLKPVKSLSRAHLYEL